MFLFNGIYLSEVEYWFLKLKFRKIENYILYFIYFVFKINIVFCNISDVNCFF